MAAEWLRYSCCRQNASREIKSRMCYRARLSMVLYYIIGSFSVEEFIQENRRLKSRIKNRTF